MLVGALLGAALALTDLVIRPEESAPTSPVIATVNGQPILRSDHARALRAVSSQLKGRDDPELSAHILQRLIDESLLVERGLELGLGQQDPFLRTAIASAVIDAVKAEVEPPSQKALALFHRENAAYFAHSARFRLQTRPRGRLPSGWVSERTLVQSLGASNAALLTALKPNTWSAPITLLGEERPFQAQLLERAQHTPELSQIEDWVRQEYLRRAGEEALEKFLKRARARAKIERFSP